MEIYSLLAITCPNSPISMTAVECIHVKWHCSDVFIVNFYCYFSVNKQNEQKLKQCVFY